MSTHPDGTSCSDIGTSDSCLLSTGLVSSIFGVKESVRICPNPNLYRMSPNLESVSVGSKCPYRLYNTAKVSSESARIRPNPTLYRIRPNPETPYQVLNDPPGRGIGDNHGPDNIINVSAMLFMWSTLPAFGASTYVPQIVLERRGAHPSSRHPTPHLIHH